MKRSLRAGSAKRQSNDALEAVIAAAKRVGGAAIAETCRQTAREVQLARDASQAKRRQADRISRARVSRGEGSECDEHRASEGGRLERRRGASRRRQARRQDKRASRQLAHVFQARRKRDGERELAAAERLAERALSTHGIRHHYRPLPRVAFFAGYMAGLDANGALALRALRSINMPEHRIAQVLAAAFRPQRYTPRRDVCTGDREGQKRFRPPDRPVAEQQECSAHAIRVMACAVFLWLAKTRTGRARYSYLVRGFGRGVFTSLARIGKDALFGHARGMPGALVALRQAGFVEYHAPPAESAQAIDRGPSGFAYNQYWFPSSPEEMALGDLHRHLAEVARLPLLARLTEAPSTIERELRRSRPPPRAPDIRDSEIPF